MDIEKVTLDDVAELLSIYEPYVTNTAITFEYDVPALRSFKKRIAKISSKYPYIKGCGAGEILDTPMRTHSGSAGRMTGP